MRRLEESCHIVNAESVSGHVPVATLSIYIASKFAVAGLGEYLWLELAESPIGLSIFGPGIVKTDLLASSAKHRSPQRGGEKESGSEYMDAVIESRSDSAEIGGRVVEGIRADEF